MALNHVVIVGRLHGDLKTSYNAYNETFFDGTVAVQRLSGTPDYLPAVIPANVAVRGGFEKPWEMQGRVLRMTGAIKTYNRVIDGKKRHFIVLKVAHIEDAEGSGEDNRVSLIGKISKPPIYRETPFGREICDFMLAVDRSYWRSDNIPCIAWGGEAKRVAKMAVGQIVELTGRFQSREYVKTLENGVQETRTAYEVSAKTVIRRDEVKRLITEPEKEK